MESAQSLGDLTERNVELIARMEKASHIHRTCGARVADLVPACVTQRTYSTFKRPTPASEFNEETPRMNNYPVVYVIDDEPAVRDGLRLLLERQGLRVEVFSDALAFMQETPPDQSACLILDLALPGMSGLELQEHLRSQGITWPIIFISGQGSVPAVVEAMQYGAVNFFTKPFDEEDLLVQVHEALAEAEKRHQRWEEQRDYEQRLAPLTKREREVLGLVVSGLPNKEIAHRLHISTKTVEAHRAKIMLKTRAQNLVDLVRMINASRQGHPGSGA